MVWPNPKEKAILTINGQDYSDWETVMVRHSEYDHPWYHFRFTCSEGVPLPKDWPALRIVPGMRCSVTLGGEPAIYGLVCSRQVYVDSRRHYIEIQGASNTIALTATAISKTGEYKNVNYQQYATGLLQPFPDINFLVEGGMLPDKTFKRISVPPGTSVIEALDIPLRALGGIALTSNPKGDVVALVGPSGGNDTIYEGDLGRPSYLDAREIIYNPGMAKGLYGIGQRPGSDKEYGAQVASRPYWANTFSSFAAPYQPQVVPAEGPPWSNDFLQGRTNAERDWQFEDEVTVFATVQGWFRPSGGLWQRNQFVTVISPMLVMDAGMSLKAKSVTFTQDNLSGTRTNLELCNARALAGFVPQGPGGD